MSEQGYERKKDFVNHPATLDAVLAVFREAV